MGILLLILKIIGIILGSILGFLLLLLLIILLTPFRVNVDASLHEKDLKANVLVHFWFKAVAAKITFSDMQLKGVLRILFIKKNLLDKSFKKEDKKKDDDDNGLETEEKTEGFDTVSDEIFSDTIDFEKLEAEEENETVQEANERVNRLLEDDEVMQNKLSDESDKTPEVENLEDTFTYAEKAETVNKDLEDKIDEIIEEISKKYELTNEKVQEITQKVNRLLQFIQKDTTKGAISYVLKKVKKILLHIAPRSAKGYVRFGLSSPDTMGTIVSYLALMYPFIPKSFNIQPVFDTDEFILDFELKFRMRLILMVVLFYAVPILLNRNVRAFLKDLKKLKNKE